jgi:hypothetical protein
VDKNPTLEQLELFARDMCRRKELTWMGFRKDDNDRYTIPVISSSEYKLVLAVIKAYSEREAPSAQPAERELTDEAQAEYKNWKASYDGCSCHISPPCGSCTDPGNPANQEEDESAWKPQQSAVMPQFEILGWVHSHTLRLYEEEKYVPLADGDETAEALVRLSDVQAAWPTGGTT